MGRRDTASNERNAAPVPDSVKLYNRYHKGRWEMQKEGPYGPGSCFCCPNGGPYAGKKAPKSQ